jgi:hypothetical protein
MSSQNILATDDTNKHAFALHRRKFSPFLKNMPFLLRVTWPVTVLLTTKFNICASEQLSYKDLAQRLLLSRDGTFHILSELLDLSSADDRCTWRVVT